MLRLGITWIVAVMMLSPMALAQSERDERSPQGPLSIAPVAPLAPLTPIAPPPTPPLDITWSALRLLPDEAGEAIELPPDLGVSVPFDTARCRIEEVERIARQEGEHQVTELTSEVRCEGASVRIAGTRFGESRTGCAYNQDASLLTSGRAIFHVSDASGRSLGAIELRCRARRPGIPADTLLPANAAESP